MLILNLAQTSGIVLGFLFHVIGDYVIQNSWMANEKTKRWFPAFIHTLIYSSLFYFLVTWEWWLVISVTHYFIDRYRLAVYFIKLREGNWKSKNFGFSEQMPSYLSLWLLFITDNVFHLIINSTSIYFSNQ